MATAILTNDVGLKKGFRSKIKRLNEKKEFSMKKRKGSTSDIVSAKERLSTPFRYKWLKFKTGFFGLVLQRGVIHERKR